jgi:hypothetical protein
MRFAYRRLASSLALGLTAAACTADNPVSPAGGALGQSQILAGTVAGSLPGGSVNVLTNVQIDPSLPDAMGRSAANTRGRFYTAGGFWIFYADQWRSGVPQTGTSKSDPRYPLLQDVTAPAGGEIWAFGPNSNGDDYWDIWTQVNVSGLKPNTQYEVAFVRYSVGVAGEIDQVSRILRGTVNNPDTLKITSGTIARTNSDWGAAAPAGCDAYPGVNANPYVFATEMSSATGVLAWDKCFLSSVNGLGGDESTLGGSVIGPNNGTAFQPNNYNYIVIYEGTVEAGIPVRRLQIAQDLNNAGAPLPNGFAPFPAAATTTVNKYSASGAAYAGQAGTAATDRVASLPVSYATQLGFPGASGPPDSLVLSFTRVQELAGSKVYKTWYVNKATGAAVPAPGRYTRTLSATDTAEFIASTSTFKGGPGTISFVTEPYTASADIADSLRTFLVTIEESATAAEPSVVQPYWVNPIIKPTGALNPTTVVFGEFNFDKTLPAVPYIFRPQGTFRGAVLGDTVVTLDAEGEAVVEFVGTTISLNFTALARPPRGYEYRVYLCTADCNPAVDSVEFFDLGTLEGPDGEPLVDEDVAGTSGPNVAGDRISSAHLGYDFSTASGATLCDFDRVRLAVQPRGAEPRPTAWVLDSPMNARVLAATSCR